MTGHQALIGLQAFGREPRELLRQASKELHEHFFVEQISSVYKIFLGHEAEGLCVCLKLREGNSYKTIHQRIEQMEASIRLPYKLKCYFLCFGSFTLISQPLTVPFPDWHQRADLLAPAVELWPNLTHPVLQRPLTALLAEVTNAGWGEFLEQGQRLLDF